MKIVLVEKGAEGSQPAEHSFNQEVVRFGRDASKCDVAFSNDEFRMVSRNHALLAWKNSQWKVYDLKSSFGTFLNGNRISEPQPIAIGDAVQLGQDGPTLFVIFIETPAGAPAREGKDQKSESINSPSEVSQTPQGQPKSQKPQVQKVAPARLELIGKGGGNPKEIQKEVFWLGRDPGGDIVIAASAVMVSRKHAEIRRQNGSYFVLDNDSFNGTLVNEQRISAATPLYDNDRIQLGRGGPVLKFNQPGNVSPHGLGTAGQRSVDSQQIPTPEAAPEDASPGTMVFRMEDLSQTQLGEEVDEEQLLMRVAFNDGNEIKIGRNESNDISLDGLQISGVHARLRRTSSGISVEDLNSTNGVYVNGERVTKQVVDSSDSVQIGSFLLRIDETDSICVFDTRSKTRIDSIGITKDVKNRAGRGMIRLLDDISLSIQPNEFVGLLGPSGAGKSTYMDALNGTRPATDGSVFINNLDLYRYIDSLKQSIGYVPQDDIIHRELTVYRTLYYVAKLRLSSDVSRSDIDQIINEVLDVTGLDERRGVPIVELSGGQRKRVSIAVELITKPSIIYLDEPTSGLDPVTEEKIMKLFRQIAESGRTVILTTHAMENVKLFDKVVILMRGKLVFYGNPDAALKHLGASNFKDVFDKLEEPVEEKVREYGESERFKVTDEVAEDWKQRFLGSEQYKKNVYEPLREVSKGDSTKTRKRHRLGILGAVRQWATLSRRYFRVLSKDKLNLFILFAQAPIIAILVYFVMGVNQPRDFVYFALSLCSIWFGTSVAAREIVRERPIYERERMVNLGVLPYLGSKLFVLGVIVALQCVMLFVPLKFLDLIGLMPMPGIFGGIPQFIVMLLTAAVGIALGLFVSALVKTSEMATSLIPLILIPQIVFSGLIGVPEGINRVVGLTMPATWSFDTIKRFSGLDTLEPEGALKSGKTEGLGLYKSVEKRNEQVIANAKKNIKEYEKELETKLEDARRRTEQGEKVQFFRMPERPQVAKPAKIPENLSSYVTFLHPWMHSILNQLILMVMFFLLVVLTLIVLRLQDIG